MYIQYLLLHSCKLIIKFILFRIAFNLEPLVKLQIIEIVVDILLMFNIIVIFFTLKKFDRSFISKKEEIAVSYLKGTFFLDALSVVPSLIVGNKIAYHNVYYFKIIRVFSLKRFFNLLKALELFLRRKFIYNLTYVSNFINLLK